MLRRVFVMVLACALAMGVSTRAYAGDSVVLKMGTLAPAESDWGKVFRVWAKAVEKRSNGKIKIQFFWNGQQGDEVAMVGKIRTGQLDGAALTATGLAQIHKQVLVLQLPGLFKNWAELDKARSQLQPEFDREFEKAGFKNLGWGDVGEVHVFTKGFPVRKPADLKRKKTYYFKGDPISPMFYSVVGDVTPRELTVPELTAALTAGNVNVVSTPSLAAEQLQWAPQLDHVNKSASGYVIGAVVFSNRKFNSLSPDQKKLVEDTGRIAAKALTKSIRAADKRAYERLQKRMKAYDLNEAEKAAWKKLFKDVRHKLRGATFKAALVDKLEAQTGN